MIQQHQNTKKKKIVKFYNKIPQVNQYNRGLPGAGSKLSSTCLTLRVPMRFQGTEFENHEDCLFSVFFQLGNTTCWMLMNNFMF